MKGKNKMNKEHKQSLTDVSNIVKQTFKNMEKKKNKLSFDQAFKIWYNAPKSLGLNTMCMDKGVVVLFKDLLEGEKIKSTKEGVFVQRGGKWIEVVIEEKK